MSVFAIAWLLPGHGMMQDFVTFPIFLYFKYANQASSSD